MVSQSHDRLTAILSRHSEVAAPSKKRQKARRRDANENLQRLLSYSAECACKSFQHEAAEGTKWKCSVVGREKHTEEFIFESICGPHQPAWRRNFEESDYCRNWRDLYRAPGETEEARENDSAQCIKTTAVALLFARSA